MKKNKKNIKKEVKNILNFYKTLGIQISLDRFIRSLPKDVKKKEAVKVAESLGYEFRSNETERVKTLNKKWSVLTDYIYLFDFTPFVEFVIVSGSLALGNVEENSDFDVIVGAKTGRIFTVRFLCAAIFGIFGLRKQKEEKGTQKNNKFCFNHFVTPSSYELDPPHNIYWTQLYRNLIPVYGNKEEIRNFFSKNQWAEPRKRSYSQLKEREEGLIMRSLEFSWQSKLGNWLEEALRRYQIYRIKKSLKKGFVGYNPQLNYSGRELRFHMDTRRIENILEKFNE